MEFIETLIKDLYLVRPFVAHDERGAFIKDYSEEEFSKANIVYPLKETFYTISKRGVIRGMHFQKKEQQPKLVRCIKGTVYDVIVDLRKDSPTFKVWQSFILSDANNFELLIPAGCAHGYMVLEDSIVSYKCANKFYSQYDSGIKFDDPDININWPEIDTDIVLSEKDKNLQSFQHLLNNYNEEF